MQEDARAQRGAGLQGLRSGGGESDRVESLPVETLAGNRRPHGSAEDSGDSISVRSGGIASAAATPGARVKTSDLGTVLKAGCNGVLADSLRCPAGGVGLRNVDGHLRGTEYDLTFRSGIAARDFGCAELA